MISSVFARAANASTMASKHVLAEFASMHSRAATAWEEEEAVPAADIKLFSAKAKSGWHLYLAEQRSLGIKMKEIGENWHNLTRGEKDDYNKQAKNKANEDKMVENLRTPMPSYRTPLGLGGKRMPVREDVVEPLCHGHNIKTGSHTWKRRYGKLVEEDNDKPEEAEIPKPRCSHECGLGFCRTKIDEETKLRMAVILQQLQAAAKSLKGETHLPMIVVDGIIPGAVEQKAQAVLLRVFALHEPTVRE